MQKSTRLLVRLEWRVANTACLSYFMKDLLFKYAEVGHLLQLKQFRCTGFLQLGLLLLEQTLLVFIKVRCFRLWMLTPTLAFIVVIVGLWWTEVLTRLVGVELGRHRPISMVVAARFLVQLWLERASLDLFKVCLFPAGLFELKLSFSPEVVVLIKLIVKVLFLAKA